MKNYRCPICGRTGSLIMSQRVDRTSGKISWSIRMLHKNKEECHLCTIKPRRK